MYFLLSLCQLCEVDMNFRCTFVALLVLSGFNPVHPEIEETVLLKKALQALRKGLKYMEENMLEVNLDGIFGVRLVQEHLLVFLKFDSQVFDAFDANFRKQVEELYRKASYIVNEGIDNVKRQEPDYYQISRGFLEASTVLPWYPSRTTNSYLRVKPLPCEDFLTIGEFLNGCYKEIFGTGRSKIIDRCNISKDCVDYMSSSGKRHYVITHQLLFFLELEMKNCLKRSRVQNIPESVQVGLCTNIMRDAEEIANSSYPLGHQDLFVEQIGFCGLWGFRDFYKPEWLENILEWQGKSGCYYHEGQPFASRCTENLVEESKRIKSRVRRDEKVMSDYCLSHKTSFALTAITASIRFLAEKIAASRNMFS